ncbi:hypothetical protein [Rhizobium sp. RAF56]|uniref:hypothetical protein n=1 Tax=Rhizobium sp. RAF56 TaxID=3233062 RepID=UPI003F9632F5
MIKKPLRSEQYSDRQLDCQQALELAVHYVIDQAVVLGWQREEALLARWPSCSKHPYRRPA